MFALKKFTKLKGLVLRYFFSIFYIKVQTNVCTHIFCVRVYEKAHGYMSCNKVQLLRLEKFIFYALSTYGEL